MPTCRPLASLLLLTVAASGLARAGVAEGDVDAQQVFTQEVDVVSRAAASEVASVEILEGVELAATGALTVGEALAIGGVHVLGSGSRGALVAMRGGGPNLTLVLLDGVPLNDHTEIEGGAVDVGALSLEQVERIEIVRGPLSFFLGSSPLSGMINIVTRRGDRPGPQVTASVGGGSPDFATASATLARGGERHDLFLAASWNRDDRRLADDAFEQYELRANGGRRFSEHFAARFSGRFASTAEKDYPEASGGPIYGDGELRDTDSTSLAFSTSLDFQPAVGRYHGFTLALLRQDRDRTSPAIPPALPPSTESARFTKARAGWVGRFDLARGVRLSGGVDVERDEGTNESLQLLPPAWGGPQRGDYALARTTPGAFLEVRHERGALLLEGGVRVDLPEHRDTAWSPRLGLRWRTFADRVVWRASAGRSFKLPSFFVLGSPPTLGGNPDLLPERSTGFEAGADLRLGATTLGVVAFRTRYEKMIDFDFPTFSFVNRTRVDADGVEITLAGPLAPTVNLRGGLTWQQVEDHAAPDVPVLHEPEWRADAAVTWQTNRVLLLSLAAHYVSQSYDSQLPVPELSRVNAGSRIDLAAEWKTTEKISLRLRLENLADSTYQTYIGFPEAGFNGRLTARWSLGPVE